MQPSFKSDVRKLQRAIRRVQETAALESQAMHEAEDDLGPRTIGLLRIAHHAELNAVQALVGLLDLLERRQPAFMATAGTDSLIEP